MSEVFFTSDLHFGHPKMAILRGFKDSVSHDEHVVATLNKNLTKHDTLYILGDIALTRAHLHNLGRLVARKYVVLGNHDMKLFREIAEYVYRVEGVMTKSFGGHKTVMTHIPIHPREFYRWELNIHGHLHEKVVAREGTHEPGSYAMLEDVRYFNVSPERWNFYPVHRDTLLDHLRRFI